MPSSDRKTVLAATPTLLVAAAAAGAGAGTRSVVIKHKGAGSIFIGGAGVTTANGFEVEANGSSPSIVLNRNEELYGRAAADQAAGTTHVLVTDDVE